jgi:beta-glucanase (GH16 family)
MPIGSTINTSSLTQTFGDEFNSFSASPNGANGLWQTSMANGVRTLGGNGEQEYYSDTSVGANPFSLQNGVLDITATPGGNAADLPYNSGVITTQSSFNQLYGYFEMSAKLPAGQGLWPAFWLLPASGAWPPELDTFEVLGNTPSTLYFSTHSSVQATQGTTVTVPDVSAGFNLYGVMWGPKTVDLYINNIEVASMPTPADMNVPMHMLANLAVGGYWPGNPNSTTTRRMLYRRCCIGKCASRFNRRWTIFWK